MKIDFELIYLYKVKHIQRIEISRHRLLQMDWNNNWGKRMCCCYIYRLHCLGGCVAHFCDVIEFCVSWISNANKGDIQVSCCHLNTRRDELDCALKMKCCFCICRRRVFSTFYSKVGAKYCFESSHKRRKWLFMR